MNLDDAIEAMEALAQRKQFERWRYYMPVPKQQEFLAMGATKIERMLMAGNGNGKTETAGYEISRHMCGEYPRWWTGHRIKKPPRVWIAGTSAKAVTEAAQTKLLGQPGNPDLLGSGLIPRDAIIGTPRPSRGYPDAVDSFQVRCRINGRNDESAVSRAVIKTYAQTRDDWQGADIDWLWEDEEPPAILDTEGTARLRGRGNKIITFTPVQGRTAMVNGYYNDEVMSGRDPRRGIIRMGINDATWYSEEERANQVAGYPPHERAARANGEPFMGAGQIFLTPMIDLMEDAIPLGHVPANWKKLWGIDFGGGSETAHPFAAVLIAIEEDEKHDSKHGPAGVIHVLDAFRMTNALILQHADRMKQTGANVPVAWPHDGHVKDRNSGESLAALYRRQGLNMLEIHSTHTAGGYSTRAGNADLDAYMQSRRFKVARHLREWFDEYAQYHYDEKNEIVKIQDDILSATRTAHIMRRRARAVFLGSKQLKPLRPTHRPDINPWTGRRII